MNEEKRMADLPRIALAGPKGGGKTWVLNAIAKKLDIDLQGLKLVKNPPNISSIAFADPIYDIQSVLFNFGSQELIPGRIFNEAIKEQGLDNTINRFLGVTPRGFRQQFGTEFARNTMDPDIWVNIMKNKVDHLSTQPSAGLIIMDTRFPNELEYCKRAQFMICYVNTMGVEETGSHASESHNLKVKEQADILTSDEGSAQNMVNIIAGMLYTYLDTYYTTSGLILPKGKLN